jgi:predicted DNA-binding protein
MATAKKRINISVPKDTERMIERLAKRDQVPQATKAAELLRAGLEAEEDMALDEIAGKRDRAATRFVSHTSAWK